MITKNSILNKNGFWNTLKLFSEFGNRMELKEFYKKYNKESYYNSFYRVKEDLIEKEIIKIDYLNKKQHIELTSKGQNLINLLKEVIEIIK